MDWLKIIDQAAGMVETGGKLTGNPGITAIGALVGQVIDSEHDDQDWLEELTTEKLLKLNWEINKILIKR